MTKIEEKLDAIVQSVARIELIINVIMKDRYGEEETKRVFAEVQKLVEDSFKEVL